MEVHRVSTYHDVEHALRITDLKQSLYDEGKILMDKVLVTLHGDEHRQRRSIESQLFRKNFFRVYENEVFPGPAQRDSGPVPHTTRHSISKSSATASWCISHCPSPELTE